MTHYPIWTGIFQSFLYSLGIGLSRGADNKKDLFIKLYLQIESTPRDQIQTEVLVGFFSDCARSNSEFFNSQLDELVTDELIGEWMPRFQSVVPIDSQGLDRLSAALEFGKAPVEQYQYFIWGQEYASLTDDEVAGFVEKLLAQEGGRSVAIKVLQRRFSRADDRFVACSALLRKSAENILMNSEIIGFSDRHGENDFELAVVIKQLLNNSVSSELGKRIVEKFADAIESYDLDPIYYPLCLESLVKNSPAVFLDVFLSEKYEGGYVQSGFLRYGLEERGNPLDSIEMDALLAWCDFDPNVRYPKIAGVITAFTEANDRSNPTWTPIAHEIINRAPELDAVLEALGGKVRLHWNGTPSAVLDARRELFPQLGDHPNVAVRAWAERQAVTLKQDIERARESERARSRNRDQQFED